MSSASIDTSRVWLITGASAGIGFATVKEVLAAGERVAATTRRASSLASLTESYPATQLLVIEHDVADATKPASELISRITTHFGRLDVVVNNAGYGLNGVVESISDEEAHKQFDVNFWAAVRIAREAVRHFREHNAPEQGGRILNISSIGGFVAQPTLAFYCATKFALDGFSEGLQKELDPKWNIKVISVRPGGVRTLWAGENMATVPLPAAYADPQGPAASFIQIMKGPTPIGDPYKVARALITVSKAANPPRQLLLGPDALVVAQGKLQEVRDEIKEWKEVSLSTVADDADTAILQHLNAMVAKESA
ncbi:NAD(P)-binding protein [Pilatotrama ljubarskyi]|nr:NAD(P)-binding protein [Pilatotrama ljubarskyi]